MHKLARGTAGSRNASTLAMHRAVAHASFGGVAQLGHILLSCLQSWVQTLLPPAVGGTKSGCSASGVRTCSNMLVQPISGKLGLTFVVRGTLIPEVSELPQRHMALQLQVLQDLVPRPGIIGFHGGPVRLLQHLYW